MRISKPPEQRRQELVDAARELFASRGYEQTAVSDIVKKVGVAQGLFYYYFHAKKDIFLAVVDQFIQANIKQLADMLGDKRIPPLERIHNLMRMLAGFLRGLEGLYPGRREHIAEMYTMIQGHVCDVIEPIVTELLAEGTAQGVLDAPFPERMARFFIAGFIGVESMPSAPSPGEMMELIRLAGARLLKVPDQALG